MMSEQNRQYALEIFEAGVKAADPRQAVVESINDRPIHKADGNLYVVAVGKAAPAMAQAVLQRMKPTKTLIVTTPDGARPVDGARVIAGAHPIPTDTSVAAGQAVCELLSDSGPDDHVLALISGGGSSLMVAPSTGLSWAEKAEVNRLLLASGLDITAMNLVRQNLSRLKGGGLLRAAAPSKVTALILSDVVGDDLRVVASGPTTAPIGTKADARDLLQKRGIWDELPAPVKNILNGPDYDPPNMENVSNRLVGSNARSVAAMGGVVPSAHIHPHALEGDVQDAAQTVARCKKQGIWLFGGETTVRLTGSGKGGRNQELALRVALEAERHGWKSGWVFLSGGTDGRDGPTDAAGGAVDGGTLARMRAAGIDPQDTLESNDSYTALKAAGDLLITGETGTNVADLQVLIRP